MRSDRFYLGGVNRVLSYYCLFYLGAVVRELQKTVRTEKYHYWKMVVVRSCTGTEEEKAAGGCNRLLWTKFDGDSCTAFPVF